MTQVHIPHTQSPAEPDISETPDRSAIAGIDKKRIRDRIALLEHAGTLRTTQLM